ncbi:HD domain-containing phosphohydrolase [Deinococcus altitudinis]|uniref:HD domain-containing phosphohydrolase n=1 Tax=Deinococcus altitudinis TaxID=468914 RepID=UPI0038929FCB
MLSPLHRSRLKVVLSALLPVGLGLGVVLSPRLNPELELFSFHALLVGAVAVLALLVTLVIGMVGVRQRNVQVVLLSLASGSLALVYAVHGLASPEAGVAGVTPLTAGAAMPEMPGMSGGYSVALPVAAQLGALFTAFWLGLSVSPSDSPALRGLFRLRGVLLACWMVGLGALSALLLLVPGPVAGLIRPPPVHAGVVGATLLLAGVAAWRSWQSWRYSRFPLQLGVVYAALWLGGAQVILVVGPAWTLSWWIYHFLLVGVTAALLTGLLMQGYRPELPLGTVLRGLWNNRPDDLLAAGISRSVQAMVASTEAHDPYTAGHSYRVALHALRLARELGHGPESLRAIIQGGILHDIGKLDVPAHILNAPGQLSAQEWSVVQAHPLRGYERCRLLGFLPEELGVIRSHHERWDGAGYPDRLVGSEIPELARLLSIADVYDALTSRRSYRDPWSHERANAHIQEQAGVSFDPALVAVWLRLPRLELQAEEEWSWRWSMAVQSGAPGIAH